jgi:hypothetical protein
MAWMQRAYIDAQVAPWYKKVYMRWQLFIERHFKKVKGNPGAAIVDSVLDDAAARSKRALYQSTLPKPEDRSRAALARMWDSL